MADSHDETETAKLIEAFAILRQNIGKALEIFGDPDAPRTLEMERELQHTVLARAGQFFAVLFGKRFADKYFFEPASAFTDLNNGIVRPLMEPSPPRNRADPSNRWRARARVAVALDALMCSGLSQTEAADKIARDYKNLCVLAGKKAGNLSTAIINWRQEFRRKRVKNFEAAELFAEGIRRIGKLAGDLDGLKALAADQLKKADRDCAV
jgi:hypothetical protein